MKVTILGCGGASGVPGISMGWGACDPNEPRNQRRRSSILVEDGDTRILVDSTPDLRDQLLDAGIRIIDGLIYTHDHADHLHGIDDLREINRVTRQWLPVWAKAEVLETARQRFGYAFEPMESIGEIVYRPLLTANVIDGAFRIGDIPVVPFDQDHGYSRTLGLRFGNFAYSTDVVEIPEESFKSLEGVEVWVIGCLVDYPHATHAHVEKALEWIERVRPRRAILTHMGTRLDYQTLCRTLPPWVEPAYDGMIIEVS
ncbi:MBL fold metallo-hydrolase [Paramagnetospirillum kuznetsovii]|uniref:MBL fold metallo-hydrolase n=1 Tax=Paramagnetospirillum kuznetsovii TaxID=2053833 RepID=A0A364NZU3_9PROT|nr:MBL fold metallo-hydrolase [Paramagnetospirillum kuznetsovii]RAU22609.1 MBL fold metallo-hydrolase [Paramagnetospirillum kuznetsovii]